jgi:hypothetical protein
MIPPPRGAAAPGDEETAMARKAKKKSKKGLKAKDLSSRSASSVKGGAVGPCFRPRSSK